MSATFFIQRLQTFFLIFYTFFTFFNVFYFHLNVYYILALVLTDSSYIMYSVVGDTAWSGTDKIPPPV